MPTLPIRFFSFNAKLIALCPLLHDEVMCSSLICTHGQSNLAKYVPINSINLSVNFIEMLKLRSISIEYFKI